MTVMQGKGVYEWLMVRSQCSVRLDSAVMMSHDALYSSSSHMHKLLNGTLTAALRHSWEQLCDCDRTTCRHRFVSEMNHEKKTIMCSATLEASLPNLEAAKAVEESRDV